MESSLPEATAGPRSEPAVEQLVIVGTDTDVGKTVVSALVVQGLGAYYLSLIHI